MYRSPTFTGVNIDALYSTGTANGNAGEPDDTDFYSLSVTY